MLNTRPLVADLQTLQAIEDRAKNEALIDILLFPVITQDNLEYIEAFSKIASGFKIFIGKSTGGFILPFEYLPSTIERIRPTGKPVTTHCEDQEIIERNTKRLAGQLYPEVHCDIRSADAEIKSVRDVGKILSLTKYPINIAHVSTAGALNIIKSYKAAGFPVTCELTPHHSVLTRKDMARLGNYGRMNPPLRSEEDRQASIQGLSDGSIDFFATDHAPHTKGEKESENPPSGVPIFDNFGNVVTLLIKEYNISLQQIMRVTSYNAAKFLGLNDRGRIEEGNLANLTVLDLDKPYEVTRSRLYTNCGWSPFEGMKFPGQVRHTIYRGQIVSNYDKVFL